MTAEEYIKQQYGETWLRTEWSAGDVIDALDDYGRYCSEEAWKEAIQQHSMLSLSNMVNGGFVMKSPDEWWSEFQRKEETK